MVNLLRFVAAARKIVERAHPMPPDALRGLLEASIILAARAATRLPSQRALRPS